MIEKWFYIQRDRQSIIWRITARLREWYILYFTKPKHVTKYLIVDENGKYFFRYRPIETDDDALMHGIKDRNAYYSLDN